jgi:hypothetical protein
MAPQDPLFWQGTLYFLPGAVVLFKSYCHSGLSLCLL